MFDEKKLTTENNPSGEASTIGYKDLILYQTDVLKNSELIRKSIENGAATLISMDKEMSSLGKSMGVTSQYSQLLKQELGRAVTEVTLMGGKQSDINALQKDFIEATNRTIVLSTENIENLYAVSQVSGVSVKALEIGFRNAGMETAHISEEMKTVYHTANSLGVNAQTVSTMVVANLDKMNRYGFGNGVEGMAKMAAKAAAMRVDISQTMAVADKLFSPESAIEVASTLQRLGATSSALLDPLKLMDLAQNNVPELQNQLSELSKTFTKFDKETGKFQIMPEARRQLKEVADALGIDRTEFEKMALESAKLEKKMGEIDFSALKLNVNEDQKMMLANLAEFNKSKGDYTVKFTDDKGVVVEKALSALEDGDLEKIKLQQQTLDPQKELVDIAKQQLGAANTLIAQDAALTSLIATQYAISNEGNEFLKNSVNAQGEILKSGFDTFSLTTQTGKDNSQKLVGDIQGRVNKVVSGDVDIEDIAGLIADFSVGLTSLKPIMDDAVRIAAENPVKVIVAETLKNSTSINETLKKFGIETDILVGAVTKFAIYGEAVSKWFEKQSGFKTEEKKDIAITADGMHYSLDKGDMLMAVNQRALASSIGGSVGPLLPSNEGMASNNTTSGKKELVLTLNVNANSNDPQIKNAILSAFNNDDTLRTLRDKIGVVGSDYGLTV